MREKGFLTLMAGENRHPLPDGTFLRLLSAMEVLEARREAEMLAGGEQELALCANACLVARAWEKRGAPLFSSGEAVLRALPVSQIQRLARTWAEFDREENPGPGEGKGRLDALKKAWSTRLGSAFGGACSASLERSPQRRGRGGC